MRGFGGVGSRVEGFGIHWGFWCVWFRVGCNDEYVPFL